MKIVISNGGQLGNKLWSYSSMIAHSYDKGELSIVIDFEPYTEFFEQLDVFGKVYFIKNRISKKILKRIIRFLKKFKFLKEFDITKNTNGISLPEAWDYRNEDLIRKYHTQLHTIFQPKLIIQNRYKNYLNDERQNSILIGVHFRRGDYLNFCGGAYYFSIDFFEQIIYQLNSELVKLNKKVVFLLCSNEDTNIEIADIKIIRMPNGANMIDDLYGLSECDYILGPPSTFSMWASFYGRVPLFIMRNAVVFPSISDFKVIRTLDIFEDNSNF